MTDMSQSLLSPTFVFHSPALCPTLPASHTFLIRQLHSPVHAAVAVAEEEMQ